MSPIEQLRNDLIAEGISIAVQGKNAQRICDQLAAIDALIAERDEQRRDKDRMDWIQTDTVRVDDVLRHFVSNADVDIRAAIDAAMRKDKP